MGMQDKIFRVVIPEEEETDFKDGKKRTVMKKTSLDMFLWKLL